MRRRTVVTTAVTAAGTLLAGCTSGDGGSSDDGSGSDGGGGGYGGGGGGVTTETTTAGDGGGGSNGSDSAGQEAFPDYDWEMLSGTEPTETTSVTLENTAFHPLVATVSAGTEVTFTNEDAGGHTVTIPAMDVDARLSGGGSTTVTFDETGSVDYVCTFHPPAMLGRVVVE